MPSQVISSVENNFTKGLITESTGLNFPENAATDTQNCIYEITGDVVRRLGIAVEPNTFSPATDDRSGKGMSSYVWSNVGGESNTKWMIRQVGAILYIYDISSTLVTESITDNFVTALDMSAYAVTGSIDLTQECTYATGNGYLFIFHPNCDPMYIYGTNAVGVKVFDKITLQIRDLDGLAFGEGANDVRPANLTTEHQYNLANQGWTSGPLWIANSATHWTLAVTPSLALTVQSGLTIAPGTAVSIRSMDDPPIPPWNIPPWTPVASGVVISYSGTTLTLNVSATHVSFNGQNLHNTMIVPENIGQINTFVSAVGLYPSNSDVWWYFKDNTGVFNPATTVTNVSYGLGQAPRGHFILNPFTQDRSLSSTIPGITPVATVARPTNGAWFAGRVWYTGVASSFAPTGDALAYTWTENIYFSQIVNTVSDFPKCYQSNDPTSENLNSLLPTDGGIIKIPGVGTIYKLFPTQNGMLVFGSNGVWYITGSQGIGFTATDYTITKISSVQSISNTSFIDVLGLPYFWNEEGIYQVQVSQNGSLAVEPITVGTILSFYNDIPFTSKKYARGDYNAVDYIIQWTYRSQPGGANINSRYQYDKILNYNTYNKAFYPYDIQPGPNFNFIHDIKYVTFPTISDDTPEAGFYYPSSYLIAGGLCKLVFALEFATTYLDWGGVDYSSYFVTGYKLHGQGMKRFQVPYLYIYSRGPEYTSYMIQGIWDYAADKNSNRWSVPQITINPAGHFNMKSRRHRIRGNGLVLQFKVNSVTGKPFDIMGWAVYENLNQGV